MELGRNGTHHRMKLESESGGTINISETEEIILYFDTIITDQIIINLKDENNNTIRPFVISSTSSQNIAESRCKVYMRILPHSEASALNEHNFKTYNAFGADDNESNIQTDVRDNSVIEKSFSVKSASGADEVYYFEVVKPRKENVECVEGLDEANAKLRIPIKYILQHTTNKKENVTLKYSVTSNEFAIGDNIGDNEGNISISLGEKEGETKEITLPGGLIRRFQDIRGNKSFRERVGQHFTGTREPPKLTLRYTLEVDEEVGGENKKEFRDSNKKGSVEFYLTTSDNCRRQQEIREADDHLGE